MKKFNLILLLILSACTTNEDSEINNIEIQIDLEKSKSVKLSDYFSSIEYIFLSNNENNYLAQPYTIVKKSGLFFVRDILLNSILIFDGQGTLINAILSSGAGPGEFQSIDNFFIGNEFVYVKDVSLRKMLIFDHEGNFISETQNLFGQSNFYISEAFELWYLNNQAEYDFRIIRKANDGEISTFLNYDEWMADKSAMKPNSFIESAENEKIYFQLPFGYELAQFSQTGFLERVISLDFGKHNFKSADRNRIPIFEQTNFAEENDLVDDLINFFPVPSGYFAYFTQGRQKKHQLLFDENFEIKFQAKNLINDLDGLEFAFTPWFTEDNSIYFLTNSNALLLAYRQSFGEDIATALSKKSGALHDFVEENLLDLQEENNILVKLTLK
ncbi:6-bladed beta-propeller [Cecembia sp.]|uniref:6-bladed beta-propeller n=1 Tax=Cecembia sp. TaxID=1898110 RepID=UPI0025B97B52|nr:6-bladed beta-propeller [Cecembia sp.]